MAELRQKGFGSKCSTTSWSLPCQPAAAALTAPTSLPGTRCSATQKRKSRQSKESSCFNQFVFEAYRLEGRRVVKDGCRQAFLLIK